MRRADRLFQIIQILRRAPRPMTAAALAEKIETSRRTVYRDITDLIAQRVPISGEAGIGYVLDRSYDMPPLMFTPDEIEAVALGSQWVATLDDKVMSSSAASVLSKIASSLPDHLLPYLLRPSVGAKPNVPSETNAVDFAQLRLAVRQGRKVSIAYRAATTADEVERVIWPVVVGYDQNRNLLIAWCELRQDFRHFRTDRIVRFDVLDEAVGVSATELRNRWERWHASVRRSA